MNNHTFKFFQACAVTQSMNIPSATNLKEDLEKETQMSSFCLSDACVSISRSDLLQEQRSDPTLQDLFQSALSDDEIQNHAENKVLLRKWVSCGDSIIGEPVNQAVVPLKLRDLDLHLNHHKMFCIMLMGLGRDSTTTLMAKGKLSSAQEKMKHLSSKSLSAICSCETAVGTKLSYC